jgi:hypothetical protein
MACPTHGMSADPLTAVTTAVDALVDNLDRLVDACTSSDGSDLAAFLLAVREAKDRLYREVEPALVEAVRKAMLTDTLQTGDLKVERYRSADRKAWDHDAWRRDVRTKLLRHHGLLGAQGVLTADGEVVGPELFYTLLRELQEVHGSHPPKTGKTGGGLRQWGLDPDDYCATSEGVWQVRVQRLADESATETTEGDAA